MKRALLVISILIAASGALPVHAQSSAPETLSVSIEPSYPRPYGVVTVTPSSTLIDLSASVVTISANGAVIQKGSGTQSADVQLGGPGSKTTITVTAVTNGQTFQKQIAVRPSDVSLIMEPSSTVPLFYRGSPLVASEGRIRLIALPDIRTAGGAPISATNLVYTWRHDDQILQDASGIGKSVLTAIAPVRYRDATISVTVSSMDGGSVAQAATVISPIDPFVRLYRNDPLLGPWLSLAIGKRFIMSDSEETFRAVPYFFSSVPSLSWMVNGTQSQTSQDITVRPAGSGAGTAQVGVTATDSSHTQTADASMSVTFGSSKSAGIFGL